jgi:hypothetical protein
MVVQADSNARGAFKKDSNIILVLERTKKMKKP